MIENRKKIKCISKIIFCIISIVIFLLFENKTTYASEVENLNSKVSGLQQINNAIYYYGEDGSILKGWHEILGKKYYFDEIDGKMKTGETLVDGIKYNIGSDGSLICGWYEINNDKYYYNEYGYPTIGKVDLNGIEYMFSDDGKLVIDKVVGLYTYDEKGNAKRNSITVDNLNAALDEILQITGNDITQIGKYVKNRLKYKYIEKMGTREEMAVYALNHKTASCYYYAALTGLLLERAGYETITVEGKGFVYAEHNWNLVKTSRNGIEGWYHVDSLKGQFIKTDAEMVANKFVWPHEKYPATP